MKNFLALAIASFALAACGGDGVITGKVKADQGEDLTKAQITVTPGDLKATPAADGSYKIEGLDDGDYSVKADLTGYTSETKTVKVPPGNVESITLKKP